MNNFDQAMEQAEKMLKDPAVLSVNITFITSVGHSFTATVYRYGIRNVVNTTSVNESESKKN